jgi:hypothetical protein
LAVLNGRRIRGCRWIRLHSGDARILFDARLRQGQFGVRI